MVRHAAQNALDIFSSGFGQGYGQDALFKALPRLFPDGSGLAMLYLMVSTSILVSSL